MNVAPASYQPADRRRSVKRESGLPGRIGRALWWWWVRGVLSLTEQIKVIGREHLPASVPFVIAANMMNALPLWRKNCGHHAIAALRQRLVTEPCGYILFPEGTRSRTGQINPFRHGIGMLVAATPVPVIPCHLDGTFHALPPGAQWPRPTQIVLRMGAPLQFAGVPNQREGWETIARDVEQAVRALPAQP
jgi:1-acyl-sn-glycerol-3-phosphate acyltransferase